MTEAEARLQHFPILAGMPLVRWIKGRAKDVGGSITDEAAQLLAGFVGGDLRTLANEVDKLATYAGPGQAIDVADVEALVSQAGEASIFACVDAVAQGDRRTALSSLAVLLEGGEKPERVLALVARQVRLLLQARDLSMRGEDQEAIGRALGVPPYPLRKVLDQMRLFQVETLEGMLRRVLEADVQVKTGELESRLALELLIAELCAAGRERGRRPVGVAPGAFTRAPAGGAAVRRGRREGVEALHQAALAPGGVVGVDDPLPGGAIELADGAQQVGLQAIFLAAGWRRRWTAAPSRRRSSRQSAPSDCAGAASLASGTA